MLEWSRPQITDGNWIREIVEESGNMGSDCTFANIYLLRNKYDTEICRYKEFLIRRYYGSGARKGYTFPIGTGDVKKALREIEQDAKLRGEQLQFAFVTEEQKSLLESYCPGKFEYHSDPGDSDYVYFCSELATLSGKSFHKKKNHVSRFFRTYPDCEFAQIGCNNWEDALRVADVWYNERIMGVPKEEGLAGNEARKLAAASLEAEYHAIQEALENMEELQLSGGVIYVNAVPVAMTVASNVNAKVCNIHFEKVIGEYALAGGYAAINQVFAKQLEGITYINREEDVGIEGLRKAKMSYHPKLMIKKYSAIKRG